MKKFKFKLNPLLLLRSSAREKKLLEYGSIVSKRKKIESKCLNVQESLNEQIVSLNKLRQNSFLGNESCLVGDKIQTLKEELSKLKKNLKEIKIKETNCFKNYYKAKLEEDVLLNFRDRKKRDYISEIKKREYFELDEITQMRHARKITDQ